MRSARACMLRRVLVAGRSPHVQVQEVIAGSSYLSMDSLDLEFGLGSATAADNIEIRWPSGVVQDIAEMYLAIR